jgi:hypothetical protein
MANGSNIDRLLSAEVLTGTPPQAYADVVTAMSEDEVQYVIGLKQRLDQAREEAGGRGEDIGDWRSYFLPP